MEVNKGKPNSDNIGNTEHALTSTIVFIGQHHSWATFWGWGHGVRSITLKFELGIVFSTVHLLTKFPMFNCPEVVVLTNRDCAENIHLTPLCYASRKRRKF